MILGHSFSLGNTNLIAGFDAQALAHYNRVIADGGVADLKRVDTFFKSCKAIYGVSDLTTVIPAAYDAHYLGYKLGAGTGTTAGQAAAKLYSLVAGADVTQATVSAQPLLLAHTGTNYYFQPRIAGNTCTSNSQATFTGGSDTLIITAQVFLNNQNAAGTYDDICQQGTLFKAQISNATTNKIIRFAGSANATASSSYTPSTTVPHYIRITVDTTTVTYEWSANGTDWTGIGTSANPTFGTTGTLTIGGSAGSTTNCTSVYNVTINVNATNVRIFNPASYNAATSQTGWVSATGETWSIVTGTATTGYKGVLADRSIVMGDGVDDKLTSGGITSVPTYSLYTAYRALSSAGSQFMLSDKNIFNAWVIANTTGFGAYNSAIFLSGDALLRIFALEMNGGNCRGSINNASLTTGTSANHPSTGWNLFVAQNLAATSNSIISTLIMTTSDLTKRTEVYSLIRSLNNNAF